MGVQINLKGVSSNTINLLYEFINKKINNQKQELLNSCLNSLSIDSEY